MSGSQPSSSAAAAAQYGKDLVEYEVTLKRLPYTPPLVGTARDHSDSSDKALADFHVRQIIATVAGSALVKVLSVTNSGGVTPVGFVTVQPMVHQIDGADNPTPHGMIHSIPYFRLQGGANAVICDPCIGDIGIAVFTDRDNSNVIKTRKPSPPGSRRQNSMSDGVYLGGVLNAAPTQVIAFSASGITLTSPTAIVMNAPNITLNGNVGSAGTFQNNNVNIGSTHKHNGVQTGSGTTGVPQ